MSKLTKRKTIVLVGNRIDTIYEMTKNNREKAIEVANNTPDEIKNKKIRYLLKKLFIFVLNKAVKVSANF